MENNYHLFFGLVLDMLIQPWEKLVLGQKYNEVPLIGRGVGAMQPLHSFHRSFYSSLFLLSLLSLYSSALSASIVIYEQS